MMLQVISANRSGVINEKRGGRIRPQGELGYLMNRRAEPTLRHLYRPKFYIKVTASIQPEHLLHSPTAM